MLLPPEGPSPIDLGGHSLPGCHQEAQQGLGYGPLFGSRACFVLFFVFLFSHGSVSRYVLALSVHFLLVLVGLRGLSNVIGEMEDIT